MLAEALAAKSRELGHRYSYRALEEDSGVNYSLVSKVIHGKAPPTEAAIRAWGRALAPYFNVDLALVDAGYMPATPTLRAQIRALVAKGQLKAGQHITKRESKREHSHQPEQKPRSTGA